MRYQRSLVFAIAFGSALTGAAMASSGRGVVYDEVTGVREFTGELIVRPVQPEAWLAQGLSPRQSNARVEGARLLVEGYDIVNYVWQTDEYIVKVPAGSHENVVANDLLASGLFQYAEPNYMVFPLGCPDDSRFGSQWHHNSNRMQSCDGWDLHTGNPTVSIGICDTGIRTTHEDFQLHRLEGYNAVDQQWESEGGRVNDLHGHGTATTGCAAANGDNGVGVSGVGWNLSHRMLRVSNSSGGGSSFATLQHAARTSVESGDKVASVSYSGVDFESNLTTASYIKSIGGLMVWAAGNEGRTISLSNRDDDDLIVVGATDEGDRRAGFSNFGPMVDIVAPGNNVYTCSFSSDRSYGPATGTSFACPLAAGMAAMIWSADPSLTPDEVESLLKAGVDDLGSGGPDNSFGYGRINLFKTMSLIDQGGGFELQVDPMTGGQVGSMRTTGGTPGEKVYFIYSLRGVGSTFVPRLNVTLDLDRPSLAGSSTANGNGEAAFSAMVPSAASGRTLWFQAAEFGATTDVASIEVD